MACWPLCDYARSYSSFLRAQHVADDAAEAMGEVLEESCLAHLATAEGSSRLAARLLGHAIAAT
jgi:hypothetical protein